MVVQQIEFEIYPLKIKLLVGSWKNANFFNDEDNFAIEKIINE